MTSRPHTDGIEPSGRGRGPATSRGRGLLTRRTFLADVGRATLGAVVLGPALVACTDDGGSAGGPITWERASLGFVSAYVLVRDGEAAVFDTGNGDDAVGPIAAALEAAGVGWGDVGHVIVSHRHGDHVGGLAGVMAEAPDAVVYGAMPDLDAFRDGAPSVTEVADGDTVLGLRIVATPGHTDGHISAFDEGSSLLLAGDAIVNGVTIGGTTGEGIEPSPPDFTDDTAAAVASVSALADLRPATILFGHGDPVTEDAAGLLGDAAAAAAD